MKLLVDKNSSLVQVYAIPQQAAAFSAPHTRKKHSQIDGLEAVSLYGLHKRAYSVIVERLDLLALYPWEFAGIGGIEAQIADFYGLL